MSKCIFCNGSGVLQHVSGDYECYCVSIAAANAKDETDSAEVTTDEPDR